MHPVIRRTLNALSVAYALAWAAAAMAVGPGSATFVALTGDLAHAGIFVALFSVSSATGAFVLGRLMDRFGRKRVLVAAHLVAAFGYTVAGLGTITATTALFTLGAFLFAFSFGGILLTRVAAAEIFPATLRGRGVGRLQASATAGAILGPLLLILSDPLGRLVVWDPLILVWFFGPLLHLTAALFITRIHEPLSIARKLAAYHPETQHLPPPKTPNVGTHVVPIVILALAANQAAMAAVMGVAGAFIHHAGHAVWVLGLIMSLHFVGMFALSPLVGRIADRFGRRNTILTGITTLALGGLVIAGFPGLWGFTTGLVLIGFGWSFGFIGATILLADIVPLHRRARIVGRGDMSAQLSAAAIALVGGWWFALHGASGLGVLAVAVALIPLIGVLFIKEPRPGHHRRVQVPPAP